MNHINRNSDAYKLGVCEAENKKLRMLLKEAAKHIELDAHMPKLAAHYLEAAAE